MNKSTIAVRAEKLLSSGRSIAAADELLRSGQSTFGRWCLPGLLPQECTAALYGPTGAGKTFVALHLAISLASGASWFGNKIEPGTIAYFASENRPGVEARGVAAARHIGLSLGDLPIEFLPPEPIHTAGWADVMNEVLDRTELRYQRRLTAVFLDTLGATFGGNDQNDSAKMTIAADAMQAVSERFKCAFVAVHHSGKDIQKGLRGSQVLKDRVDTVLALNKTRDGGACLTIEKQRNGPTDTVLTCNFAPVDVDRGGGLVERTRVVADLVMANVSSPAIAPTDPKPHGLSRDTTIVLEEIRAAKEPVFVRNLKILTEAKLIEAKQRNDGAVRSAISNAKKQLISKGYIELDPSGETVRIRQKASEL
jgi:hypothetical protein